MSRAAACRSRAGAATASMRSSTRRTSATTPIATVTATRASAPTAQLAARGRPRGVSCSTFAAVSTASSTRGDAFDDRTITTLTEWQGAARRPRHARLAFALSAGDGGDRSVSKTGFGDFPVRDASASVRVAERCDAACGRVDAGARAARGARRDRCRRSPCVRATPMPLTRVYRHRRGRARAAGRTCATTTRASSADRTTGAIAYGYRFCRGVARDARARARRSRRRRSTISISPASRIRICGRRRRATSKPACTATAQAARGRVAGARRRLSQPRERPDRVPVRRELQLRAEQRRRRDARGRHAGRQKRVARTSVHGVDRPAVADGRRKRALLPRRARRHGVVSLSQTFGRALVIAELVGSSARFDDAENLRRMGGYGLVNLALEWTVDPRTTIFMRARQRARPRLRARGGFRHRRRARVRRRSMAAMTIRESFACGSRVAAAAAVVAAIARGAARAGPRRRRHRRDRRARRARATDRHARAARRRARLRGRRGRARSSASSRVPTIRPRSTRLPVIGDATALDLERIVDARARPDRDVAVDDASAGRMAARARRSPCSRRTRARSTASPTTSSASAR